MIHNQRAKALFFLLTHPSVLHQGHFLFPEVCPRSRRPLINSLEPLLPGYLLLPSTKSRILCAFALRNPHFQGFRAQNRYFCALLPSKTLIFGHFEHKIEVFVLFCPPKPPLSVIPSTKLAFLCSSRRTSGSGKRKRDLPANHRARFKNSNAS